MIGDEEVRREIVKFEVGESVESDHHPLIVTIGGGRGEGRKRRRKKESRRRGEGYGMRNGRKRLRER